MKRAGFLSLACIALSAGPVLAAFPAPEDPPRPAMSRGTLEKIFEGEVSEFAARRFLTITMEGDETRTFRLDERDVAAIVDPAVAVGSRVRVVESRTADGQRTVTVRIAGVPAPPR
ncbi:MAG: hypothetical protein IPN03_19010 [Holophagales bacterium]|nr:hypothetical protein [Holophagales bacterium]MBK9375745.1 hypothetical protein [Holophagales bacterium]